MLPAVPLAPVSCPVRWPAVQRPGPAGAVGVGAPEVGAVEGPPVEVGVVVGPPGAVLDELDGAVVADAAPAAWWVEAHAESPSTRAAVAAPPAQRHHPAEGPDLSLRPPLDLMAVVMPLIRPSRPDGSTGGSRFRSARSRGRAPPAASRS